MPEECGKRRNVSAIAPRLLINRHRRDRTCERLGRGGMRGFKLMAMVPCQWKKHHI